MNMIRGIMPCSRCSSDVSSIYPIEVVRVLGDGASSYSLECPYCHLFQVIDSNRPQAIRIWNEHQAKDRKAPEPTGEPACPGCGRHKPFCDCPEGMYDKKPQPSGELREWWIEPCEGSDCVVLAWRNKKHGEIHAREVPSPDRVRAALDEWAFAGGWRNWNHVIESGYKKTSRRILKLLQTLGIDTDGL